MCILGRAKKGSCISKTDLFEKEGHSGPGGKLWGDESVLKPDCGDKVS